MRSIMKLVFILLLMLGAALTSDTGGANSRVYKRRIKREDNPPATNTFATKLIGNDLETVENMRMILNGSNTMENDSMNNIGIKADGIVTDASLVGTSTNSPIVSGGISRNGTDVKQAPVNASVSGTAPIASDSSSTAMTGNMTKSDSIVKDTSADKKSINNVSVNKTAASTNVNAAEAAAVKDDVPVNDVSSNAHPVDNDASSKRATDLNGDSNSNNIGFSIFSFIRGALNRKNEATVDTLTNENVTSPDFVAKDVSVNELTKDAAVYDAPVHSSSANDTFAITDSPHHYDSTIDISVYNALALATVDTLTNENVTSPDSVSNDVSVNELTKDAAVYDAPVHSSSANDTFAITDSPHHYDSTIDISVYNALANETSNEHPHQLELGKHADDQGFTYPPATETHDSHYPDSSVQDSQYHNVETEKTPVDNSDHNDSSPSVNIVSAAYESSQLHDTVNHTTTDDESSTDSATNENHISFNEDSNEDDLHRGGSVVHPSSEDDSQNVASVQGSSCYYHSANDDDSNNEINDNESPHLYATATAKQSSSNDDADNVSDADLETEGLDNDESDNNVLPFYEYQRHYDSAKHVSDYDTSSMHGTLHHQGSPHHYVFKHDFQGSPRHYGLYNHDSNNGVSTVHNFAHSYRPTQNIATDGDDKNTAPPFHESFNHHDLHRYVSSHGNSANDDSSIIGAHHHYNSIDDDSTNGASSVHEHSNRYATGKDVSIDDEQTNEASSVHEGQLSCGKASDDSSHDATLGFAKSQHEPSRCYASTKDVSIPNHSDTEASIMQDLLNAVRGNDDAHFYSAMDRYRKFRLSRFLHKNAIKEHESKHEQKETDGKETAQQGANDVEEDLEKSMEKAKKQAKLDKYKHIQDAKQAGQVTVKPENDPGLKNDPLTPIEDQLANFNKTGPNAFAIVSGTQYGTRKKKSLDLQKTLLTSKIQSTINKVRRDKMIDLQSLMAIENDNDVTDYETMDKKMNTNKLYRQSDVLVDELERLRAQAEKDLENQLKALGLSSAQLDAISREGKRQAKEILREEGYNEKVLNSIEDDDYDDGGDALGIDAYGEPTYLELLKAMQEMSEQKLLELRHIAEEIGEAELRAEGNDEEYLTAIRRDTERDGDTDMKLRRLGLAARRHALERKNAALEKARRKLHEEQLAYQQKHQAENKRPITFVRDPYTDLQHLYNRAVFEKRVIDQLQLPDEARAEAFARAVDEARAEAYAQAVALKRAEEQARMEAKKQAEELARFKEQKRAEEHIRARSKAIALSMSLARARADLKDKIKAQAPAQFGARTSEEALSQNQAKMQEQTKPKVPKNFQEGASESQLANYIQQKAAIQAGPAFDAFKTVWEHMRGANNTDGVQKPSAVLMRQPSESSNEQQIEQHTKPNLNMTENENEKKVVPNSIPEMAISQQSPRPLNKTVGFGRVFIFRSNGFVQSGAKFRKPCLSKAYSRNATEVRNPVASDKVLIPVNSETAAITIVPSDKGLASNPFSQPVKFVKTVVDKLLLDNGGTDEDVELRCPVHLSKNSNGEIIKDSEGNPVQICQCRLVKTNSTVQ